MKPVCVLERERESYQWWLLEGLLFQRNLSWLSLTFSLETHYTKPLWVVSNSHNTFYIPPLSSSLSLTHVIQAVNNILKQTKNSILKPEICILWCKKTIYGKGCFRNKETIFTHNSWLSWPEKEWPFISLGIWIYFLTLHESCMHFNVCSCFTKTRTYLPYQEEEKESKEN
jgi:hypothetical protein